MFDLIFWNRFLRLCSLLGHAFGHTPGTTFPHCSKFWQVNSCVKIYAASINLFANRLLVDDRSHFLNSVTWTTGKIFEHFKFLTFWVLPLLPQIHASFVCFVLLFLFHYETTTKAKFIYTLKKLTVEPEIKSMKMGWIRMAMKLLEKSVRWCQFFRIIIVWPRPLLKWPNLKCRMGHMAHFD